MGDDSSSGSFQTSSTKDNLLFPGTSQRLKLQDPANVPRLGKSTDNDSKGQSCNAFLSRPTQRQHGKGEGVQELVKYMSRVPSYLQPLEKTETGQTKALNMGVIDWGHLQKWKDSHTTVVNQEDADPFGRRDPSSSKIHGRSFACVKKTSSGPRHLHEPHRAGDHVQIGHKKASRPFSSFLNIDTTFHSVELPEISKDCSKSKTEIKDEQHKVRITNFNFSASGSRCNSQEFDSCFSASSITGSGESSHSNKPKTYAFGSPYYDSKKIPQDTGIVHTTPDYVKRNGQLIDGMQTIEDFKNWSGRFSFESAGSENPGAVNCEDFSGVFLLEDLHNNAQYSNVPHSCPFPLNSRGNELLEDPEPQQMNSMSNPLTPNVLYRSKLHAADQNSGSECSKNNKDTGDGMDGKLPRQRAGRVSAEVFDDIAEAVPKSRKTLPADPCTVTVGRYFAKEVTTVKQLNMLEHLNMSKTTCPESRKGRRNPMKRILDTLLKSRIPNHGPGTVSASPVKIVRRLSFAGKTAPREDPRVRSSLEVPPDIHASFAMCVDGKKSVTSALASYSGGDEPQCQKHETPKRKQALVRLVWKDQLPVFTFSMNNSDVLVAVTKRAAVPNKYDSPSCYTIYNISEAKKTIGAWMNQGSKQKEFVSRAVGKMFYSLQLCHKPDGRNSSAMERQFILIGPELRPAAFPKPQFVQESELAAFVIRMPECTMNNSARDVQKISDPIDSCNTMLSMDKSFYDLLAATDKTHVDVCCCDTIAILPHEIHGSSDTGEPSPLIDRWKSGGLCDCGGWDVGCSLTILAGNLEECKSKMGQQPAFFRNGMLHGRLFVQGGSSESMPVFHLSQVDEGLYEVEFEPFIVTLQAFSFCVAILHCQRPESLLPREPNFLQQVDAGNSHNKNVGRNPAEDSTPTSYVPHHPPLSPVRRA